MARRNGETPWQLTVYIPKEKRHHQLKENAREAPLKKESRGAQSAPARPGLAKIPRELFTLACRQRGDPSSQSVSFRTRTRSRLQPSPLQEQ